MFFSHASRARILGAAIGAAALLSQSVIASSAERPSRPDLTAASQDYARTVNEGTAAGAMTGAALGAAVGAAVGRGGGGALAGGIIGTMAGMMIGHAAGTSVANKKQEYARRENSLNRSIAQVKSSNAKLESLVSMTAQVIAAREEELSQLNAAPDPEDRRDLIAGLDADLAAVNKALVAARRTQDTLRANLSNFSGSRASALSAEAQRTKAQVSQLTAQRDELVRMRKSI